jgi:hypothetical protein
MQDDIMQMSQDTPQRIAHADFGHLNQAATAVAVFRIRSNEK